ncbi:MAG: hypothetical protein ABRQ39_20560, partial [Candidatus Eremiobacterota bacterium]
FFYMHKDYIIFPFITQVKLRKIFLYFFASVVDYCKNFRVILKSIVLNVNHPTTRCYSEKI